ncbi:MAG: hypothetical protein CMH49_09945 [Myxococcales bacterium]|nr:hypothetical protein [Myxococcales bacterium]
MKLIHLKTFFLLIVLSIAYEVQAETKSEANKQVQTQEMTPQSTKEFRAYFAANGFVNGSFITEPKSKTLPSNGQLLVLPYPGFGGVGGGGGLNIGIAWKALSLDIGLDWSVDQGEGRINGQTFSLSQTTRHIPLTLRAEIPNWAVRPSLIGGLDWVSSSDTKLETPIGFISSPPLLDPESQEYTAWIFGFGLDFMLNDTLRIPFRILAVYAPLDRSDLSERIELESNGFRFNSQWEWQPRISLGLSYDFKSF